MDRWRLAEFGPIDPVHDRFEPSQISRHKQGLELISDPLGLRGGRTAADAIRSFRMAGQQSWRGQEVEGRSPWSEG